MQCIYYSFEVRVFYPARLNVKLIKKFKDT